jgi:hypothetical protein
MGYGKIWMTDSLNAYPGSLAKADEILELAGEFRQAAYALMPLGRRGSPLSRAPCRFSAIHSIELHLNALLLHAGHEPARIRAMQHNLAMRIELAMASGLKLRKRTASHILAIVGNREYLVTRYGPEMTASVSQLNRLTATLDEVAKKVAAIMKAAC